MISRYTNPEMGRIWSDQRRYETWLQVEVAAAEAMAAAGIVPAEAARDLRDKGAFDIARIDEIEKVTQHDVIAFTTSVAEKVGPSARWLHFGLTSSDVIDTAQAVQMVEACDVILKLLAGLAEAVKARAVEHKHTPMIGRTHGVHAEVMTFGLKLALWYADLGRCARARAARARGRARRHDLRRGRHVRAPRSDDRGGRLPPAGPRARRRVVAGDPARSPRRVAERAGDHRRLPREVRARDSRAAEDRDRRGRRAVRQGAEGLVGDAAQAQPDWLRADRRPGPAAAQQRDGGAWRTSRCGTSATSRTRRSSA